MIAKREAIKMAKKMFGSLQTAVIIGKFEFRDEMLRPSGHYYMLVTTTCPDPVWKGTVEELIDTNPEFKELTVLQHGEPETTEEKTVSGRELVKEYYDSSAN